MKPAIEKVAIQGARGSFHELAAMKYFSMGYKGIREEQPATSIQCIECVSFKEVFRMVMNDEADFGITAIENTVAGTILPNYAMLRESGVKIIGEVYLHIEQNLLALNGQTMEDIMEVHSHPMAILQCHTFLERYPRIRLVETNDTAASARWIADKQLISIGAIAGKHVAGMYNLQLLAEGIETHKKNFTRFLVLKKFACWDFNSQPTVPDKTSFCFTVSHQKGSLAKVLTQLAMYDINLTKIQSLPIIGREWEYYIHIDMEFERYDNYRNALSAIKPLLGEFKVLGEYKRGTKIEMLKSEV